MINKRNKFNVKDCYNCYLKVNGIVYEQWTDGCGNKEEANKFKKELIKEGYKAIIRLIDKSFYRVYKELN